MKLEKREGVHGVSDKLGLILFGAIILGRSFDLTFDDEYFIWSMFAFLIYFFERGLFRSIVNNKWVFEGITDLSVKIGNRIRSWMGKNQVQELSQDKREEKINFSMALPFLFLQLPLLVLAFEAFQYLMMGQFYVETLLPGYSDSSVDWKHLHTLYRTTWAIDLWFVFLFFGHEVFSFFKSYKVKFSNLKTS